MPLPLHKHAHKHILSNPNPVPQLFGNLVDGCFSACVNDFTSKAVTERENGCVTRCVQKYMSTGQRLAERFQEHNADMQNKMGGQ